MEKLFNLTPHAIHLYDDDGKELRMPAIQSDGELRLKSMPQASRSTILLGTIGLPVVSPQRFTGLDIASPGVSILGQEERRGSKVGFIVSAVAGEWLAAHPEQWRTSDCYIFSPATGPAFVVRDAQGRILGTKRLEQWV